MPTYTSFLPTSSFLGPTSSSPARPSQVLAGSDPLVSPISTTATSIESTTIGPQEGQPSLVSSPVSNFVENFTLRWSQRSNRPPSQLKDYVCNTVRSGISPLISTSSPQSLDSGIPRPYPGPCKVGCGSRNFIPGGYGFGSESKFHYKDMCLVLVVP
ncbi:hypothetical protein M9H77_25792 [Catharanthus roseus]|uniref:Uncharacterized protein n=1 Tax=Catharanthus roseus TaxID=4058 RepID=A0ACC0A9Z2_CATRO|nr:hypothetical protein M9H77_25792 [Catharanthus roseus]